MRHGPVASILIALLASNAHAAPVAGPVPGAPDLAVVVTKDATRCGGERYAVKAVRTRGVASDKALRDALAVAYPRGLALAADDPTLARTAIRRFQAWLDDATKRTGAARARYEKIASASPSPAERVAAVARIAIIERHLANVFATAEIPAKLTTGPYAAEAVAVFCDRLDEQAAALDAQADAAGAACAKVAADARLGPGWWDAVCVAPPAP